jgi:transposase
MEKMTQHTEDSKPTAKPLSIAIGIDVSKHHLDAARYPSGETLRVENTRKGHSTLLRWIGDPGRVQRVVFEATGPYHRSLEERLATRGLPVAKVNPRQARCFAEAIGTLAKTDRVDALMLARFGALLEPAVRAVRAECQVQLCELVAARRALIKDRIATLNRLQTLSIKILKRHADHRLRQIAAQIISIDDEIEVLISNDPVMARRHQVLTSIPGLGATTARVLLATMPELGTMEEGQAASLAGLAPMTQQSGTWRGKSTIRGGRAALRRALYMPALVAIRFNPDTKRVYDRLISRGKHAKVAIVAAMRKLVVLANALIRDDRIWEPKAT